MRKYFATSLTLFVALLLASVIFLNISKPDDNSSTSESVPSPQLLGLDRLNRRIPVGNPGYAEWGKKVTGEYHYSTETPNAVKWERVNPHIFDTGLIIKSRVLPDIVTIMFYTPQMCNKHIFNSRETDYIEICGNSEDSVPCDKSKSDHEVVLNIPNSVKTRMLATCYGISMFGVGVDKRGIDTRTYMATWFFK